MKDLTFWHWVGLMLLITAAGAAATRIAVANRTGRDIAWEPLKNDSHG